MKKAVFMAVLISLFVSSAAFADDAIGKLGRGVANVASCWVEVPTQIFEATEGEGIAGGLTVGIFKGVVYTVGRCLAGVYDIVTFPLPLPNGYKSIIQPEFVLSPKDGQYGGM